MHLNTSRIVFSNTSNLEELDKPSSQSLKKGLFARPEFLIKPLPPLIPKYSEKDI